MILLHFFQTVGAWHWYERKISYMPIGATKIYYFPKRPGHVGIEFSDANNNNRKIYLSTSVIPRLDFPKSCEGNVSASALDPTKYQRHLEADIGIFVLGIHDPKKRQDYKLDKRVYTVTLPATENSIDFDDFINNQIKSLFPWDYRTLTNNCANFVALILKKLGYYHNEDTAKKYFLYPQDVYNSACKLPGATEEPFDITTRNIENIFESTLAKLKHVHNLPSFALSSRNDFHACRAANNYSGLAQRIKSNFYDLELPGLTLAEIEKIETDINLLAYLAELMNTWNLNAKTEIEPLEPHPTWKARIDMLTICAIAITAFILGFSSNFLVLLSALSFVTLTIAIKVFNGLVLANTNKERKETLSYLFAMILTGASIYSILAGTTSFNTIFNLWVAPISFALLATRIVYNYYHEYNNYPRIGRALIILAAATILFPPMNIIIGIPLFVGFAVVGSLSIFAGSLYILYNYNSLVGGRDELFTRDDQYHQTAAGLHYQILSSTSARQQDPTNTIPSVLSASAAQPVISASVPDGIAPKA